MNNRNIPNGLTKPGDLPWLLTILTTNSGVMIGHYTGSLTKKIEKQNEKII